MRFAHTVARKPDRIYRPGRVRSRSVIWVIVLGCLAAAGVVVLVVLAVGVRKKIDDVLVETRVLEERREELKELTASVQLPHKHHE